MADTPPIKIDLRILADRWGREAYRLLREIRSYDGKAHRGWYTGAEVAVLDILEGKGYIERVPSSAHSLNNYRLAPKGEDALSQLDAAIEAQP